MNNEERQKIRAVLTAALSEDLGSGDVTSAPLFTRHDRAVAHIQAKGPAVVSGMAVLRELAAVAGKGLCFTARVKDGTAVKRNAIVGVFTGPVRTILKIERLSLNLIGRMSGIASLTREFVKRAGSRAAILDTRKTTPNLRILERRAVRDGGGENHRFGLFDQVLIKDNHISLYQKKTRTRRSLETVIPVVRSQAPRGMKIEVEVDTLAQLRVVLPARPDIILLDNMPVRTLRAAVTMARTVARAHRCRVPLLEASGGITLATVAAIARTGVDRISVGALTHSAVQKDFSLEIR